MNNAVKKYNEDIQIWTQYHDRLKNDIMRYLMEVMMELHHHIRHDNLSLQHIKISAGDKWKGKFCTVMKYPETDYRVCLSSCDNLPRFIFRMNDSGNAAFQIECVEDISIKKDSYSTDKGMMYTYDILFKHKNIYFDIYIHTDLNV